MGTSGCWWLAQQCAHFNYKLSLPLCLWPSLSASNSWSLVLGRFSSVTLLYNLQILEDLETARDLERWLIQHSLLTKKINDSFRKRNGLSHTADGERLDWKPSICPEFCISYLACCCRQIPDKKQHKGRKFHVKGIEFIVAGKPRRQEQEAAATSRDSQEVENQMLAISLLSSGNSIWSLGWCCPSPKWGFPLELVVLLGNTLRHTQRCVSTVILNPVKLTMKRNYHVLQKHLIP